MLLTLSILMCYNVNAQNNLTDNHGILYNESPLEIITEGSSITRAEEDPYDIMEKELSYPEGAVYGSSFVNDGSHAYGSMCADEGRAQSHVFYQSVQGNRFKVNGIRFFGQFKYFEESSHNWIFCDERCKLDADGNPTEPIRIRIGFHKMDDKYMPMEPFFSKEIDITPKKTKLMLGNDISGYGYIYALDAEFGEDVVMETGYVSITAVKVSDKPATCWFSLFTTQTAQGFAIVGLDGGKEFVNSFAPTCMWLTGTGEYNAKKALKFYRFLSPSRYAKGKYEKVSVEVGNFGSEALDDLELELWQDDKLICTDKITTPVSPITGYDYDGKIKHVFSKHIDCSNVGDHLITVKNVTKSDEKLCLPSMSCYTSNLPEGEVVECHSARSYENYIKRITMGNIDNESENSDYSDFSDQVLDLKYGEKVVVTAKVDKKSSIYAWVDWDEDGTFGEPFDFIDKFSRQNRISLSIPEGIDVKPGYKRMRIISTSDGSFANYAGELYSGEIEDYTVNVVRNSGKPGFDCDKNIVYLDNDNISSMLKVLSVGESDLSAKVKVNYILPGTPDTDNISHSVIDTLKQMKNFIKTESIPMANTEPNESDNTGIVLGFDRGVFDKASVSDKEATFGQLYPAEMLENIKGMEISSVDVNFISASPEGYVRIYEEKKNSNAIGNLLYEQKFIPEPFSWNRIILDKPFKIEGNKGIIVSVFLTGMKPGKFYMGIDEGKSVVGYGDLTGYNGYWWSMHDLGVNANYCIRANVTGKKTPAISWLDLDKTELNLVSGTDEELKVSYNGEELTNYLYSAVLEFTTNDELRKTVVVPVYYLNNTKSGIVSADLKDSTININKDNISISSEKEIFNISIYNINGQLVDNIDPCGESTTISTLNYERGVYIISLLYSDGSRKTIKLPLNK